MANEKRLIEFEKARNNVLNILTGKVSALTEASVCVAMVSAAVDAVEVVHASWIYTEDGETRCSNCEIRIPEMYSNADTVIKSECRFCHHCGAKMDGGNEDA